MIERPEFVTDEHLQFLDELRESGITNMWGGASYLSDDFDDITEFQFSRDFPFVIEPLHVVLPRTCVHWTGSAGAMHAAISSKGWKLCGRSPPKLPRKPEGHESEGTSLRASLSARLRVKVTSVTCGWTT